MNIQQLVKASALGLLMASAGSFAADGSLSKTSSNATTQVKGVIPQMVRITGLGGADDLLDLGTYDPASGGTDMVAEEEFCVWRNDSGGTFEIEMEGDGGLVAGTAFKIDNGTDELVYAVSYVDDSANALVAYATPATALANQSANNSSPTCAAGQKASIEVRVDKADADVAMAGTYTGDLKVTVTVE